MADDFDPYHRWLGIPPDEQPPHHYRLLAIKAFENDREVIRDAVQRQVAHVRTYQLGEHQSISQKILNELATAKTCLLDAKKKAAYDAQLRQKLAQPAKAPVPEAIKRVGNARLEQFTQHLLQSGLLSASEISSCYDSLPREQQPQDAESLARELFRAGKLTKYQVQTVFQGKTKGLVFGEYRVLEKLGEGGMGVVLKAEHRRMKRVVAVKMIAGAALKSPDAVKRFYREVEAAAKLSHPNIVTAHDASEQDGIHYLVMEYVEGKDLGAIVKEKGPLPVAQAVDCILQAAKGLQYAHEEGIVHRDIKPANLLLDRKGTVKILDMGLARVAGLGGADDDKDRLTASGQVMGTCDYMAPEQALDTHTADARADIYALGCTLYRLLTGEVVYRGESLVQILLAHRESPIPSLCKVRSDVPPALDAVFQKMVAKRPEDRQQSMAEVIVGLEACVGRTGSGTGAWPGGTGILPVRGPGTGETPVQPSDEGALQENLAFLQRPDSGAGSATAKKKLQPAADAATLMPQVAADTSRSGIPTPDAPGVRHGVPDPRLAARRRSKRMVAAIAAAGVLSLVVLSIIIRIRHRDGTETVIRAPEGSEVTVSRESDRTEAQRHKGTEGGQQTSPPLSPGEGRGEGPPPLAVAPINKKQVKELQAAWGEYLGLPVETRWDSIGMALVLVPPGEFMMGAEDAESRQDEKPVHKVRISRPFYIGKHPVTVAQFKKFVDATGYRTDAERTGYSGWGIKDNKFKKLPEHSADWRQAGFPQQPDHPVVLLNPYDAADFCKWATTQTHRTVRLPTEAEWEYVARGPGGAKYPWGDRWDGTLANHADKTLRDTGYRDHHPEQDPNLRNPGKLHYGGPDSDGYAFTSPVGKYNNASWCGALDMAGNVWQWCQDRFGPYTPGPLAIDPTGPPDGNLRVRRGGSWNDEPMNCRSVQRYFASPKERDGATGFRVVCEIAGHQTAAAAQDRIDLFPGQNLKGWHLLDPHGPNCWHVYGGDQLFCRPQPQSDAKNLVTDQTFRDFQLHLEFLLDPKANTGVYLRGLYEVQIVDSNPQDLSKTSCGAIFNERAPTQAAYHGVNTWNELEVTLIRQQVTVVMNGIRMIDSAALTEPTDTKQTQHLKPGDPGPIMLQCMGSARSRFKNIWIRRLDGQPAAGSRQPADPDRRAAEWALGLAPGAEVKFTTSGKKLRVSDPDGLPNSPFTLEEIRVDGATHAISDMSCLEGLSGLTSLALIHARFPDTVTWPALPNLTILNLSCAKLSEQGVHAIVRYPTVEILLLDHTDTTDEAARALMSLTKLRRVNLLQTKVTAAGVAALQKALRNCKIEWDGAPHAGTPK